MSAASHLSGLRGAQSPRLRRAPIFSRRPAAPTAQAQVKTDRERADVTALYPTAQALAVDLCDTVEFFYRKELDPATFRAKCSRWGVVYFFEPNVTQAPSPAPPQG